MNEFSRKITVARNFDLWAKFASQMFGKNVYSPKVKPKIYLHYANVCPTFDLTKDDLSFQFPCNSNAEIIWKAKTFHCMLDLIHNWIPHWISKSHRSFDSFKTCGINLQWWLFHGFMDFTQFFFYFFAFHICSCARLAELHSFIQFSVRMRKQETSVCCKFCGEN